MGLGATLPNHIHACRSEFLSFSQYWILCYPCIKMIEANLKLKHLESNWFHEEACFLDWCQVWTLHLHCIKRIEVNLKLKNMESDLEDYKDLFGLKIVTVYSYMKQACRIWSFKNKVIQLYWVTHQLSDNMTKWWNNLNWLETAILEYFR